MQIISTDIPISLESLSSRRAWIEIVFFNPREFGRKGRSPHGERGLKFVLVLVYLQSLLSRSPHGERGLKWRGIPNRFANAVCRSPHGERGLKSDSPFKLISKTPSRSPHGERGLKLTAK